MYNIVVTSGYQFTDIDALACAISYAELLRTGGNKAEAVLPGVLNNSIISEIRKWDLEFKKIPTSVKSKYVLVDISEKDYFAKFVNLENIIEIFDHRNGFESYWNKVLENNSHIENVGSCATLIWEEFKKRNYKTVSTTSANLLYTAIASNTLNFKATVTTSRDKNAFREIEKFIDLPTNWVAEYFKTQDKEKLINPCTAIINDTKEGEFIIGQLEMWDSKKIIKEGLLEIKNALTSYNNPKWFLTSPSISEGINYIYTENDSIKKMLTKVIEAEFNGDIGKTKKLWLRKEIMKKMYKYKKRSISQD